jgi:beta-lactamase superfamily II metal-dependent hydrolase
MTILKKTIILISTLLLAALISCSTQKHTTLYQLPTQTPQQMMSYVIITKDGHCIVIDGGNKGDADYLLKFIKEKTNMKKPVIDAWIFSHVHSDHVSTFIALANLKRDEFTVKKIYYNFPSAEFISKYDYTDTTVLTMSDFYAAVDKLEGTEVIIPQNNDKFTIGDVEVEILMVQDEEADFMKNSNVVNNSSMIFRLTVENQTVLFLGDSGVEQGNELLKMHGDNLKSDMVQMSHHGQNGVSKEVYEAINPSACLWPTPKRLYENDSGGGYNSGPWKTLEVREWMEELGVKHHYVDMDGLHEIRFPFKFD